MEATLASIKASIEKLREDAARFRKLSHQRRAADQARITDKLDEYIADIERKAADLEETVRQGPYDRCNLEKAASHMRSSWKTPRWS